MREIGETFRLDQIGFIDFETKSTVPIEDGTYRYMASAEPLILACAIGDGPEQAIPFHVKWSDLPAQIREHHQRVLDGDAVWAAWNASFDREAWNQITDFPELAPEHIIDVMAQAVSAGLPGQLDGAARLSRCGRKPANAKDLIRLFAIEGADPQKHPAEWETFLDYAANDVAVMREVFRCTLQLSHEDWQEYWVSEKINLAGIRFDRALAAKAAAMAKADRLISARELTSLTDGAITAVTQVKRMIPWLHGMLDDVGRSFMVRRVEEKDEETDEITRAAKHSLNRARITLLLALLTHKQEQGTITANETKALRLLLIRQYGGSTTPAKFGRMLDCQIDGELLGQFVFNGAPQTGRFSSRLVQIHNLMRDALPYELDAIDALLNGCNAEQFAQLGDDTPISRKLSMLIRPTLVPADGNAFVWGDWSQIEACVLPWLANSPGGEQRLDIFRAVHADPSLPDLYTRSAAAMSHLSIDAVTKDIRQRGKVAELACGFGGGRGALQNMAANYNMHLDDDEAQAIVTAWRAANPWAYDFWQALWFAVKAAREHPGTLCPAGRINYLFLSDYLNGSLLCILPSGRVLTYRKLFYEMVDTVEDGEIVDSRLELTFARGFGRTKMWPGLLAENVTQATAACVLRGTLVKLKQWPVRAHTHDEILLEVPTHAAAATAERLVAAMEQGFEWSAGLPLKAEATVGYSYTKCEAAQGL